MRVLALETSTMLGGVALVDEKEGLVAEARSSVKAVHSARLLLEVDRVLERAGITLKDVDALVATTGPGSFTGLRIGLSTVKGLAFSSGLPVVSVPTLAAMSWNFAGLCVPVCPVLDARKQEVYAGVYTVDAEEPQSVVADEAVAPERFVTSIEKFGRVMLCGQGAEVYADVFRSCLGDRAEFAPPHLSAPLPSSAAHLGLLKALRGDFEDPAALAPRYLRRSEAELKNP